MARPDGSLQDLDEIAEDLGVAGASRLQRETHVKQREINDAKKLANKARERRAKRGVWASRSSVVRGRYSEKHLTREVENFELAWHTTE